MSHIAITLAGLLGASGVILAAVGAHVAPGTGLDSAAYILLFHATAILGATAILHQGLLWRPSAAVALVAWVLGSALFSGDIALRALAGHRLFPMARTERRHLAHRRLGSARDCGPACRDAREVTAEPVFSMAPN